MPCCCCCKPKPKVKHDGPRRIYKGDVPYLYDEDSEILPKKATQSYFGIRTNSDSQIHPEDVTPVTVRRQSIDGVVPARTGNFPNNSVVQSRYTLFNFIPKYLYEQFRRVVNFYFLIVAFVQAIIDSPVHPITAVSPLAFVISVTAIKQGYEDWLRHKNDDIANNKHIQVVRNGELTIIKSKDIIVGDIVKLEANEQVPTDMLLIGSSDEYLRCQINTANLDGETNLKLRYCPSGLPHFKSAEDMEHLHAIIECEQPNADLYEFSGSLLIPENKLHNMQRSQSGSGTDQTDVNGTNSPRASQLKHSLPDLTSGLVRQGMTNFLSIPLSMENLLLRGTRLKNTDFIFGVVVFTGKDTRLARNSETTQSKVSTIEKTVQYYLIFFIFVMLALVIFCTILHFVVRLKGDAPWYIGQLHDVRDILHVLNTTAAFTVLFNYIIPISLYVTIELQKFLGSLFFQWDREMTDEEGREPLCNTSDLNEELGQIEYLFSDKTGTLTKNLMQFRHCSIESERYEYLLSDHNLYLLDSENNYQADPNGMPVNLQESEKVLYFFKMVALCHSVQVVPKRKSSFDCNEVGKLQSIYGKTSQLLRRDSLSTPEPSQGFPTEEMANGAIEFQASSPDEKALLEACEQLGIRYCGEKEDVMTLDVLGQFENYRRLMHLEFDADRKCMSVIVENEKGEKWLLTKGAESTIVPNCSSGPTQQTLKHVTEFSLTGLRTLALAVRKLTNADYDKFIADLRAARRLIKNRQEKVREVYSHLEAEMTLIGATGVEDQLQEFVPETLQAFAAAGIRVWMLTGDKLETGVNVAVSCGLITASTKQYILDKCNSTEEVRNKLKDIYDQMESSDDTCFVVDGDSLAVAFKGCPDLLRDVSMKAFRVVCCRMAPLQKAQVVQMVKKSPNKPTCCAVGDGVNDCAMILAAHVGIGILGKEGRQAARCADFAVAKFSHLRKAILVHGHWYYIRLANLSNYFFYKNVVFVMPQFFFTFNANFSTQALFNGLFLMNYNIFFSSSPIFFYGLLEQPYDAETLKDNPHLYRKNAKNSIMKFKNFLPWLLSALWHSVVVYYLPYLTWGDFAEMDNISSYGTVIFTGVVIASNMKLAIETKYLTWWYLLGHMYSYLTYFVITAIYSDSNLSAIGIEPEEFGHVYFTMLKSTSFWLLMLLVTVACCLPDIACATLKHSWNSARELATTKKKEQ